MSKHPAVEAVRGFHADLTGIRRDIHAHPEPGFEENRTAQIVAERLESFGIEVHRGIAKTGLVGVLHGRGGPNGRTIGLRADMDCLRMTEANTFAHRSTYHGLMHGCGHDGHTTMLLGAARYLAATRRFEGTAYFIFQPAEEGPGGGAVMIEEGLFERFPAERIFGLHNWPELPPGKIAIVDGPAMAACDEFRIAIKGRGGHAAKPHHLKDPVLIAAHLITALQSVVSRNVHPLDSAVVSIAQVDTSGSTAFNVIPERVGMLGTARTFRPGTRDTVEERIKRLAHSIAEAFDAEAEVQYARGYPATVNDTAQAAFATDVARKVFGSDNVLTDVFPTMGGEDFAYMLEKRPGAYCWLGQGDGGAGRMLHTARYDFNDEVLPLGAGFLAALVEEALPVAK
ncbi:MAG: M20 family metallopeptidase [Burkholderiales bacterium]|jgi:hippurate hydrolase|nr:M20 family metallopeptidase [Burkholderiales bacterium]